MSVLRTLTLLTIGATIALAQRRLALPDPRSCANRKYTTITLYTDTHACMFVLHLISRFWNKFSVSIAIKLRNHHEYSQFLSFFHFDLTLRANENVEISQQTIHTKTMNTYRVPVLIHMQKRLAYGKLCIRLVFICC